MTPKEFYKKYAPSSTHMVTVEIFVSRDTLRFIPIVKQKFEKILDFYYKEHSEIQIVCVSKTNREQHRDAINFFFKRTASEVAGYTYRKAPSLVVPSFKE